MATETVKSSAHKEVSGAPLPPKNNAELGAQNPNERDKQTGSSSTSARPPTQQQQQQQPQRRLSPFVITGRPEEKHLGISARNLALSDFALLRTLGTGTFARVWLTRFKADERKDRVYALKILRKAD
ncbi:cytochrome c oxidase subunit 1, partial [Elasticomyces elasticus]